MLKYYLYTIQLNNQNASECYTVDLSQGKRW
jgi:hypothetical protein